MRAIVVKELSLSEVEELIAKVWVAVEAYGMRSPAVSTTARSGRWTVLFRFDSDDDADRVTGQLRRFSALVHVVNVV